jgi:hypothetical protein
MARKVTDQQVQVLRKWLSKGASLSLAAMKSGMCRRTARKYRNARRLPSEMVGERNWRTREDPFREAWPEVEELLREAPGLKGTTVLEWLQGKYPGQFQDGQLRTLQRHIKRWRATDGPAKEVFFSQKHTPGRLAASDFTDMGSLGVTIAGDPFDHMVYHFVLTYSNWESVTICFSESFESLSEGIQNALWELDGVPERHRTDRLSAAVNNLSPKRDFTERYKALLSHCGLQMEKTQPASPHENGDVESSNGHFKDAVDQALLLRGSRDFANREEYETFLREVVAKRNVGRMKRFQEERDVLKPLPRRRLASFDRVTVRVGTGSVIRVKNNTYSVPSRLIGEEVGVRVYSEYLEVWYAQRRMERMPRLRGRAKHAINYRHVIDTLVRKPGAFENYRYRDDLFPTSLFRMAYDTLRQRHPASAAREYLKILDMAAKGSEAAVNEALRVLSASSVILDAEAVETFIAQETVIPPVTDVTVELSDLTTFDQLFDTKETWYAENQGGYGECQGGIDGTFEGVASSDVSFGF